MNNLNDIIPDELLEYNSLAKQLDTVSRAGHTIQFIRNPNETVQLAAVRENGYALRYIFSKGIEPSIPVQRAAVLNNPVWALNAMIYYNFPISKMIQWTAAKQSKEFGQIIDKDTLNHLDPDVQKYLKDDKS